MIREICRVLWTLWYLISLSFLLQPFISICALLWATFLDNIFHIFRNSITFLVDFSIFFLNSLFTKAQIFSMECAIGTFGDKTDPVFLQSFCHLPLGHSSCMCCIVYYEDGIEDLWKNNTFIMNKQK